MKKFLFVMALLSSLTSFASEDIKGTVKLNGENLTLEVNENRIILNEKEYLVSIFNAGNIVASKESSEIMILHGQAMEHILNKRVDVVDYFSLENGDEIECNKDSKGFLVLATADSILGNCISE